MKFPNFSIGLKTHGIKFFPDGTLGGACDVSTDCTDTNTVCVSGICICEQEYSVIGSICIEGAEYFFSSSI